KVLTLSCAVWLSRLPDKLPAGAIFVRFAPEPAEEPRAGERPAAIGGAVRDGEQVRRLFQRQPGEVVELDKIGRGRIGGGQLVERLVDGEPVRAGGGGGREVVGQLDPDGVAPALEAGLAAGGLDEDAAHGLGRGREEVPAAVELLVPDEPQVRLVDERRGL